MKHYDHRNEMMEQQDEYSVAVVGLFSEIELSILYLNHQNYLLYLHVLF